MDLGSSFHFGNGIMSKLMVESDMKFCKGRRKEELLTIV